MPNNEIRAILVIVIAEQVLGKYVIMKCLDP